MKVRSNNDGFAQWLLILLILLVLAAIGLAGWNVWNNNKDSSEDTASSETTATSTTKETDEPEDTHEHARPISEIYEVTLPDTWVKKTCDDSPDLLFLAPATDLLGTCQSESAGMVAISRNDGDIRHNEEYYMADDYYGAASYTAAVVDGLSGYKVSYTVATETELGYPPVGTESVHYFLYDSTADKTYSLTYTQLPSNPDHKTTFTTIAESFDAL